MSECIFAFSNGDDCCTVHAVFLVYFLIIFVGIRTNPSPSPELFFDKSVVLPYYWVEESGSMDPDVCMYFKRWKQLSRKFGRCREKDLGETQRDGGELGNWMSLDLNTIVVLKASS